MIHRPRVSLPSLIFGFAFVAASFSVMDPAAAAKIAKVRGKKVLIELAGEPAQKGDVYYTIGDDGKKKGILKINSVKGDKAIGVMGKGRVQAGWTLQLRPSKAAKGAPASGATAAMDDAPASSGPMGSQRAYWGVIGGYAIQKMDVDVTLQSNATETVSLSGNGFSGKVLFDYALFGQFGFRGMFGGEIYNVESSDTICGANTGNEKCKVNITYLAMDFWGRYLFSQGKFRPWAGLGFNLMFPLSKDATAVEDASITNTNTLGVGGGFDWHFTPTFYIPIHIEYSMFPSSEEVSANFIAVRFGLAFAF